jgi:hypothetical protein
VKKIVKVDELLMDSDNPASKSSQKFVIFKDGCPEECMRRMAFRKIENLMPMKEPSDKTRMFCTLMKGQILSYFEHHLRMTEIPENELIELIFRYIKLEYIPKPANCVKKY